jgi:hypothetical protein
MKVRNPYLWYAMPIVDSHRIEGRLRSILAFRARERRILRRQVAFAAGALIAVTGSAALLKAERSLPVPRLSSVTPVEQDGYRLLDIQRIASIASPTYKGMLFMASQTNGGTPVGSIGLVVRAPLSVKEDSFTYRDNVTATATTSQGDTIGLDVAGGFRATSPANAPRDPAMIYLSIPVGYANSTQWIEVKLRDKNGRHARFRLTDLPRMARPLLSVTRERANVSDLGLMLQASAQYRPVYSASPGWTSPTTGTITAAVEPANKGKSWSDTLRFVNTTLTPEWVSQEPVSALPSSSQGDSIKGDGRFSHTASMELPYARHQSKVRLKTTLEKTVYREFVVTFNDVKVIPMGNDYQVVATHPVSATTPSGITVTLPTQDKSTKFNSNFRDNIHLERAMLHFNLEMKPADKNKSAALFPNAPLADTENPPFEMNLVKLGNSSVGSFTNEKTDVKSFTVQQQLKRSVLKSGRTSLALTIRHTAVLKRYPLEFVVPVENAKED